MCNVALLTIFKSDLISLLKSLKLCSIEVPPVLNWDVNKK